jgi:hypothetical protein
MNINIQSGEGLMYIQLMTIVIGHFAPCPDLHAELIKGIDHEKLRK